MLDSEQKLSDIRLKALEQNVMLRFSQELNRRLPLGTEDFHHKNYAGTSLGSQDEAFADYLLAVNARFALIEFKASAADIRSETSKPMRQALFEQLAVHDDMLGRCLDLHFICWGTTNSLMLPEIDEQEILEDELISQYASRVSPYMPVKPPLCIAEAYDSATFLDDFLNSHLVGGNIQRFSTYIDELSALAKGKAGSAASIQGMVCIYIPAVAGRRAAYSQRRFIGLQHLQRFLSRDFSNPEYSNQEELERKNEIKQDYGMSM